MLFKTFLPKLRVIVLLMTFFAYNVSTAQMTNEETGELSVKKSIDDASLDWGPCPPFMPDGCNIAVLHGDPSKPNVDVLFKVSGNSMIPNHWHNSHERMVLLTGKMEVTYKGEKKQTLEVGNYAYGPAKKPHTAKCISKDPCILFIGFGEPLDAFAIEE